MDALKELAPEVKEYLENHNTERFGYYLIYNGKPIIEELTILYLDNIDTYKELWGTLERYLKKKCDGPRDCFGRLLSSLFLSLTTE